MSGPRDSGSAHPTHPGDRNTNTAEHTLPRWIMVVPITNDAAADPPGYRLGPAESWGLAGSEWHPRPPASVPRPHTMSPGLESQLRTARRHTSLHSGKETAPGVTVAEGAACHQMQPMLANPAEPRRAWGWWPLPAHPGRRKLRCPCGQDLHEGPCKGPTPGNWWPHLTSFLKVGAATELGPGDSMCVCVALGWAGPVLARSWQGLSFHSRTQTW